MEWTLLPLYEDWDYLYSVVLEGTSYFLRFYYSDRAEKWTMDISTEAGEDVLLGQALNSRDAVKVHHYKPLTGVFWLEPIGEDENETFLHPDLISKYFRLYYIVGDISSLVVKYVESTRTGDGQVDTCNTVLSPNPLVFNPITVDTGLREATLTIFNGNNDTLVISNLEVNCDTFIVDPEVVGTEIPAGQSLKVKVWLDSSKSEGVKEGHLFYFQQGCGEQDVKLEGVIAPIPEIITTNTYPLMAYEEFSAFSGIGDVGVSKIYYTKDIDDEVINNVRPGVRNVNITSAIVRTTLDIDEDKLINVRPSVRNISVIPSIVRTTLNIEDEVIQNVTPSVRNVIVEKIVDRIYYDYDEDVIVNVHPGVRNVKITKTQ